MHLEAGGPRVFPPIVATHLVKLACELPEEEARSLSTWTCAELARALIRDRIVDTISASSVQRILASEKLKPWRVHHWLSSKVPRDDRFRDRHQHRRLVHAQAGPTRARAIARREDVAPAENENIAQSSRAAGERPGPGRARVRS